MATWHQMNAGPVRYPPDKWVVIVDPPNHTRCAVICDTEAQAREYVRNVEIRGERFATIRAPLSFA